MALGLNNQIALRKLLPFPIIGLALVVILGWEIRSVTLTHIHPSFPAMQFNTALCFILAGLALIFLELKNKVPAKSAAILLGVLSGSTFLQYLTGLDFGIDLFFGLVHQPSRFYQNLKNLLCS